MKIFITGASGFVGGATLRHFVSLGHDVRAMSRSERSDRAIEAGGGRAIRCDLESVSAEELGRVDAIVHCAAFVEDWGPREAWERVNVEGTRRMLEAARAASVGRFIHIGTEAAIVRGQHIEGADESYPLAPDSPYPYCATKAKAEALVVAASRPGFDTMVLRPRLIWGPGDSTLLPKIEAMIQSGDWRWIDGGEVRTSTTHIDNLVHAIELALTNGRSGEAYFILDAGQTTIREMITKMMGALEIEIPDATIASWLARPAAALTEALWRLLRRKDRPPLTRHAVMVMSRHCTLDGSKAERDLGYRPVITREAGWASFTR